MVLITKPAVFLLIKFSKMESLGTEVLQGSDILLTRTYLLKFQVKLN